MNNEIQMFPVTGWEIRTVPAYDLLAVTLPFLAHPLQKLEEANPGRTYALTRTQAGELRDAIDRALRSLESAGPQSAPDPLQ